MIAWDVERVDAVHRVGNRAGVTRISGTGSRPSQGPCVERLRFREQGPCWFGVAAHHVGQRPEERGEIDCLHLQQGEQVIDQGCVGGWYEQPELGVHARGPVLGETVGERLQHLGCQRYGIVGARCEQRQHGLCQAGQVPLGDTRLVAVCVAAAVVDRAEHGGGVVAVHERTRPVIDGLSRDGHVVGVHDAVHEAHQRPACDQRRLRFDHRRVHRKVGVLTGGDVRVVAGDGVVGEALQQRAIAGGRCVLEGADAQVTGGHTGEHCAGQHGVAGNLLARGNHGERAGGGNTEGVHGFADDVLAQHRPERCLAVAAARERRAARPLQVHIAALALRVGQFAQQQRAAIAQTRRVATELVPCVGLCDRA
ncbi:unannotated protein [freshwater metagenome]|uniref:Unannotated protein n=1 Tax=freshwater metagenome TaxID=449393 RepID=A0A6J7F800_9ZZZZ